MKKLVWLFALGTFLAAGVYSIISLNRWEWSRALYFGLVVLVAEIGLATGLVLHKLDQQAEADVGDRDEVRDILRSSRVSRDRFQWLAPDQVASRSNVFITMVVSGGILLSGLAWLLDKVAANTTTSLQEGRLAGDLTKIAYPSDGLLPDDVTVLAQQLPDLDDPQLRMLLGRDR
jgi:hypothetical protein